MVFSTIIFLFRFLPITLALYYLAPAKLKNTVLFACSLSTISAAWGWKCLTQSPACARCCCWSPLQPAWGCCSTLSTQTLSSAATIACWAPDLCGHSGHQRLKPLGISFYTFQTLSYTIDVYRREVKTEHNIIDFGAYVVMFPSSSRAPSSSIGMSRLSCTFTASLQLAADRGRHDPCSPSVWQKKVPGGCRRRALDGYHRHCRQPFHHLCGPCQCVHAAGLAGCHRLFAPALL